VQYIIDKYTNYAVGIMVGAFYTIFGTKCP